MKWMNILAGVSAGYCVARILEANANGVPIIKALSTPFEPISSLAKLGMNVTPPYVQLPTASRARTPVVSMGEETYAEFS